MSSLPREPLDVVVLAGNSRSRDELFFTMVNRSVLVRRYDRASMWSLSSRPTLLAVSGNQAPEARSAFASSWSLALGRLEDRSHGGRLGEDSFTNAAPWKELVGRTDGLSALWFPVPDQRAGVLFERWGESAFGDDDEKELATLVDAYGLVWRGKKVKIPWRLGRAVLWLAVLAAIAAALVLVRVPLRIIAACEVAAKSPMLVSAPMDGVIDEVLVAPGQRVKAGDRLAVYDSRLMEEELKISRRHVAVVEAELASARARGFSESRYRGETNLLEARLEQELARLEALEARYERRVVTAPVDGMVQLDDARAWRGRPVSTGQAVLWLVDPADTRVKLWLPQDDRIDFDMSRPINVYLLSMGGQARPAMLTYVSSFAQPSPDGGYAFPAEAEWTEKGEPPPLGLRGSAAIYGRETSLGYWLLRRPLAWARRKLGI